MVVVKSAVQDRDDGNPNARLWVDVPEVRHRKRRLLQPECGRRFGRAMIVRSSVG